ncbi:MAG: LysM peptidoglycan-binding domain-containing protein [Candidatus Gastranaerophilaceae bacterium]|nr:LysM peptidoglycan-binding domain-containing protein [Candidatus Gastranaerophilaceae bacterium]
MDFFTKILNKISSVFSSSPASAPKTAAKSSAASIMPAVKSEVKSNEITMMSEMTDEQIQIRQNREKYFDYVKNPNHKVQKNETLEKIAKKYNVSMYELMELNGLNDKSVLRLGQSLKIPPARKIKNVKNLNDIASAMGVSPEFIKRFKRIEDSQNLPDNKFHNVPYKDSNGVATIGIGHAVKSGEKQKLTDAEVCQLCVKDLLAAEDSIKHCIGKSAYEKLPQSVREALIDMVFNKGESVITKSEGLAYCLKTGKYEAAINKMTYNIASKTGKEMAGLSKRRLFDISVAVKGYKGGKIPQSNISTIQNVYNRGIQLLRQECKEKNWNFKNQLEAYNKEVQSYFGNLVKIKLVTQ